jgi:hypothetical protein
LEFRAELRSANVEMMAVQFAESRFPPAWTVEELDACFIVKDSNEQALGYVYYEVLATYLSYAARKPQHLCAIGKSYVLAPPPHQGE